MTMKLSSKECFDLYRILSVNDLSLNILRKKFQKKFESYIEELAICDDKFNVFDRTQNENEVKCEEEKTYSESKEDENDEEWFEVEENELVNMGVYFDEKNKTYYNFEYDEDSLIFKVYKKNEQPTFIRDIASIQFCDYVDDDKTVSFELKSCIKDKQTGEDYYNLVYISPKFEFDKLPLDWQLLISEFIDCEDYEQFGFIKVIPEEIDNVNTLQQCDCLFCKADRADGYNDEE